MKNQKGIYGITCVYDSSLADGFGQHERYPIAWEVIFFNDRLGQEFSENAQKSFSGIPHEKGRIIGLQGGTGEPVHCLECVFRDRASFEKVLDESLRGAVIFDGQGQKTVSKQHLVREAERLVAKPVPAK